MYIFLIYEIYMIDNIVRQKLLPKQSVLPFLYIFLTFKLLFFYEAFHELY